MDVFFKEQWQKYTVATELEKKSEAVRAATLCTVMGKTCFQALKSLELEQSDMEKSENIIEKMEEFFKPRRNVVYESFVFNSRVQRPEEPTLTFVQDLTRLSATCDFGSLRDRLIRDRLIIGINDKSLRESMLAKPKLDLKDAVEMCRTREQTRQQARDIEEAGRPANRLSTSSQMEDGVFLMKTSERYPRTRPGPGRQQWQSACRFCGRDHQRSKESCPAYGKSCRSCGGRNHFASQCRGSKKRQTAYTCVDSEEQFRSESHVMSSHT